jgi:hypothetical protein
MKFASEQGLEIGIPSSTTPRVQQVQVHCFQQVNVYTELCLVLAYHTDRCTFCLKTQLPVSIDILLLLFQVGNLFGGGYHPL